MTTVEYRCHECEGEGWVVGPTHSPNCVGNCDKHGCPVPDRVLCALCDGEGVVPALEDWGNHLQVEFDERGTLIGWHYFEGDKDCRDCYGTGKRQEDEDLVRCTTCWPDPT